MTRSLRRALFAAACALLSTVAASNADSQQRYQQEGIVVDLVPPPPPPPPPPASNDIGSWLDAQDIIDQEFLKLYQALSNDNHQPESHEEKLPSSNYIQLPSSNDDNRSSGNDQQDPSSNDNQLPPVNDGSLSSSNDQLQPSSNGGAAKQHAWSNPTKQLAYVNGIVVDLSQIGPCSAGECCPRAPPLLARHDLPSWLRSRIAAKRIADVIDRPSSNGDQRLSSNDHKSPSSNNSGRPSSNDKQRPPDGHPEEQKAPPSSNDDRHPLSNGIRSPNRALRVELANPPPPPPPQQHGIGPCGAESCGQG